MRTGTAAAAPPAAAPAAAASAAVAAPPPSSKETSISKPAPSSSSTATQQRRRRRQQAAPSATSWARAGSRPRLRRALEVSSAMCSMPTWQAWEPMGASRQEAPHQAQPAQDRGKGARAVAIGPNRLDARCCPSSMKRQKRGGTCGQGYRDAACRPGQCSRQPRVTVRQLTALPCAPLRVTSLAKQAVRYLGGQPSRGGSQGVVT